LAMRGTAAPSTPPPNRKGHIPLLATPWCIFWLGGGAEKVVNFFLSTFLKRKHVFGTQTGHFLTIWDLIEWGGVESAMFCVYMR
jgi:hypothetical protein